MADEIIQRDKDHKTVAAGITNDAAEDISMLRVDPATDYLLVNIREAPASGANAATVAKRDQNHKPVMMGWNETTGQPQELLVDADGYILCDLLIT